MATTRICDVYGGRRPAKQYRITVQEIGGDGGEEVGAADYFGLRDLSQKALDRMRRKIDQGLTAPKRKDKSVMGDGPRLFNDPQVESEA